jgi:putative Holliday junction resolvase
MAEKEGDGPVPVSGRSRLLGVDFGTVRVGLSVSDAERRIASPLETYTRKNRERDAAHLREVVEREEIGEIVVGLPVHLAGHEGTKAAEARTFGGWLAQATGLPVIFWDERFSTVEAEHALWDAGLTHKGRKARRDRVAAQILLQAYLDAGCPGERPIGPLEG